MMFFDIRGNFLIFYYITFSEGTGLYKNVKGLLAARCFQLDWEKLDGMIKGSTDPELLVAVLNSLRWLERKVTTKQE
jgi:hypothetical protein